MGGRAGHLERDARADEAGGAEGQPRNFVLFIWIGVISGSSAWVYTSLFKITGYHQGLYWRKNYLEAVMRQDVAWFDLANPAELPTKITKRTSLKEKHRKKPRKAQQNRQRENPVDVRTE